MFLTNILLKKAKAKKIMVLMESAISGHQFNLTRERLADKMEVIKYDPYKHQLPPPAEVKPLQKAFGSTERGFRPNLVAALTAFPVETLVQQESIYRERKKIKSVRK